MQKRISINLFIESYSRGQGKVESGTPLNKSILPPWLITECSDAIYPINVLSLRFAQILAWFNPAHI